MGNPNDWLPSDDGSQLVAVGGVTGIRATSNGGIFIKALVDAGFPVDKIGDDITILDGLQAHVIRIPAPKRAGLKKDKKKDFEDTILIVGEIKALPWEKSQPAGGKKKTTASKKSAGKTKTKDAESSDDGDLEAKARIRELEARQGTGWYVESKGDESSGEGSTTEDSGSESVKGELAPAEETSESEESTSE